MKRGDLANIPMPRIHVDWRVVFVDPAHGSWWRPYAWRTLRWLGDRWSWLPGITALQRRMLRIKGNMPQWLTMHSRRFQFDLVVVGSNVLAEAVRSAVDEEQVWIGTVFRFAGWNDYYLIARGDRGLVEFIHPREIAVPGSVAVNVRPYEGFGHRPGQALY